MTPPMFQLNEPKGGLVWERWGKMFQEEKVQRCTYKGVRAREAILNLLCHQSPWHKDEILRGRKIELEVELQNGRETD